jgi:hypothetical protein
MFRIKAAEFTCEAMWGLDWSRKAERAGFFAGAVDPPNVALSDIALSLAALIASRQTVVRRIPPQSTLPYFFLFYNGPRGGGQIKAPRQEA